MSPTFDTAFYKLLNAIGDIFDRTCCIKCCFMWLLNSCDVIRASVCVLDIDVLKYRWEVIKINMNFVCAGVGSQE